MRKMIISSSVALVAWMCMGCTAQSGYKGVAQMIGRGVATESVRIYCNAHRKECLEAIDRYGPALRGYDNPPFIEEGET